MKEDCLTREMTLEEVIDRLDISKREREILTQKLYEERSQRECEFEEKITKYEFKFEEQDRAAMKTKEQNLALKDACFWLADALRNERD